MCCLGVEPRTPNLVEDVQNGVVTEQFELYKCSSVIVCMSTY